MNRRVRALDKLDLTVREGEVFGLLGPNGAGKSTTIKILLNLVRQSSGTALVFGREPSSADARRLLGYLPENPAPYEYLTGREFVTLAATLGGVSSADRPARVSQVIEMVGMGQHASLQIRRYSKGMLQRICLAQAIVHRPKLLILDEPTSGLDPVGRRQIRDLILEERRNGTTILFCTHVIPDVEAVCDRIAVLVGGNRVREGTVNELVTSSVPLVEVTVESLSREKFDALGVPFNEVHAIGERLLVRTEDAHTQALLQKVLAAGGRVTRLLPARFSLEDLFIQAMNESHHRVGGRLL
ncbi:MAG: ABC transporter ATP-binding protein [Myxococcaceae bacterium]|nr:ABC transporter ATP-binding protein [Myxococcaceae bacterium]